jgi:hypothetical protein
MPHPGINMHKLPVAGDFMGLVFVIGVIGATLISLSQARWFLSLSIPVGLGIAAILRLTSRD